MYTTNPAASFNSSGRALGHGLLVGLPVGRLEDRWPVGPHVYGDMARAAGHHPTTALKLRIV